MKKVTKTLIAAAALAATALPAAAQVSYSIAPFVEPGVLYHDGCGYRYFPPGHAPRWMYYDGNYVSAGGRKIVIRRDDGLVRRIRRCY